MIAEIALALVLLVGAGLLINSFVRMQRVDLGYDPHRLMTMGLLLPPQNKNAFVDQVLERVAAMPGVKSVALMSFATLGGLAMPLLQSSHGRLLIGVTGLLGLVLPLVLRLVRGASTWATTLSCLLVLIGGFEMRYSILMVAQHLGVAGR